MAEEAIRLTRAALTLGVKYNRAHSALLAGELRGYQDEDGRLYVYRSSIDAYAARLTANRHPVPAVA